MIIYLLYQFNLCVEGKSSWIFCIRKIGIKFFFAFLQNNFKSVNSTMHLKVSECMRFAFFNPHMDRVPTQNK